MLMPTAEEETFYTVDEVARILRVSPDTVRKLIASGELGAKRVLHQYRISKEALKAYLEKP